MKRSNITVAAMMITAVVLFLGGCSLGDYTDETVQDATEPQTDEEAQEVQGQAQQEEIPELYYAYHKLDADRQTLYREMYYAMLDMKDSVRLSTTDTSIIDTTFACVVNDHPELFYVDGYQYTEYSEGDDITSVIFKGTYTKSPGEAEALKAQISEKLKPCLDDVPDGSDEYYIVKYFYEYLISNTEYDRTAADNQNICSVFLGGRSVCQGYAEALQYMLQNMGIQSFVVTGFTNGERHAWNLVRINGEYYYVDPTWGDASYTLDGQPDDNADVPPINFDYFLVTTDELTRTHSLERVVELPVCTAVSDNYYVREGLYFDRYDADRLAGIFDGDNARSEDYVTIKCATPVVYDDIKKHLIDEREVFDFISDQGESIAYTSNGFQRTISFWNIFY